MNIRLASELPNYYATALEPPLEEKIYKKPNTDSGMFTSGGNNKRSSKEYEKDINYGVASDTANAIIDYQDYQLQQPSSKVNISSSRLTRSTTDLSESSNVIGDQPLEDFMSR